MKYLLSLCFILLFIGCDNIQPQKEKDIYFERFKWTIKFSDNLESVSKKDWAKLQQKGSDAIENTYGEEIENNVSIIFVFRKGKTNYIESNYQPFDEEIDGNHKETIDAINDIMIETFKTNIPGLKYEENRTTRSIDGLVFQEFKLKLIYPNDVVLYSYMFSRLFDDQELTVNIMYTDKDFGEEMLKAFTASKFGKKD